jgi:hypothetical protein
VSKIRILVGIDVDHLIGEAAKRGLEFNFSADVTREEFIAELKNDIQTADYNQKVEEGIVEFVNDIIAEKIEIKAHPSQKLHSKSTFFDLKSLMSTIQDRLLRGQATYRNPALNETLSSMLSSEISMTLPMH